MFALDEYARVSGVVQGRVQQGWVVPVAEGSSPFVHLLGWGIRVKHDHSVPMGQSLNDLPVCVRFSWIHWRGLCLTL
jgi:hypothetical protein